MDRQALLAEHRLELRPYFRGSRHGLDALEAPVGRESGAHFVEILLMVGRKLELAADLQPLPQSRAGERPEEPVRVVLLLGPRIGEEHVDGARMVRRQEVVEGIERLEPQHMGVGDMAAPALAVEQAHPLQHALDTQKVALGMRLGAGGQELAFAAPHFDFEGPGKIELERPAGIGYFDDHRYAFMSSGTGAVKSMGTPLTG